MPRRILDQIQAAIRNAEYDMTVHAVEEMAEDDLIFADIETAIANGRVRRKYKRDPRGTRYEVVGTTIDDREVAVICRIKSTGKLLLITTYSDEG